MQGPISETRIPPRRNPNPMSPERYQSWGRFPHVRQGAVVLRERNARLPIEPGSGPYLPFGNGRSYGDSCLNDGGVLLDCRGLNRVIAFDPERGIVSCEAGLLLSEILELIVPQGWFLPVTPGTKYVTVGGAIANDVHGKNHHRRGTFGCHVRAFELLRSDGTRKACSACENADWYRATIGGLGLTGVVTWAELQLLPIESDQIDEEVIRFANLDEFVKLAHESDATHEYSVAWIDSLSSGDKLGRGLLIRGRHAQRGNGGLKAYGGPRLSVPFTPPFTMVNRVSLKIFNAIYYRRQLATLRRRRIHYEPFFYPLDSVRSWNRLYGPRGLLEHQSVIPLASGIDAVREMLERTVKAGLGSFLTVLKIFGDVASPGLLSFPRPGLTLALDFPNKGLATFRLLDELDAVTRAARGAVYPGKDGRMSAESFQAFFPQWRELVPFIDPHFSSSFWRRVTAGA
jgi:FAD/FMN-containing dehydrogenase